ncbi:hypothetical protein I0C86_11455 [Plantactinospora sp. S1510]|uniref:Uncharacterized protein n=1 Tax=Plantactinospora alkalitolerans TaxID=2789879 RepID=A0ABS0GTP7_9ACTN|nr:hypothetical protein [Plantactinospora alkalitolerans]MBF9129575.1 hypothetical protein [Plantactinospora alkalitolerans]
MTISDGDVRGVLQRATDHLTDPPGLLDGVRQGGRRRVVRRRSVLAAGLAVAAAASVGGVLRYPGGRANRVEFASPLFDQPTRGDLAGDELHRGRVLEAWRQRLARIDLGVRGEPHVVWAGATPAGAAAYVIQRSAENPVVTEPDGDRLVGFAAFVTSLEDRLKVMTVERVTDAGMDGNSQAALIGDGNDVLLVLDDGRPVVFSPELRFAADGKVRRTFRPVVFQNGAAVLEVPPQRTTITFALSRTPVGARNSLRVDGTRKILFPEGQNLPEPTWLTHTLPGANAVWGDDPEAEVRRYVDEPDALAGYNDEGGTHRVDSRPVLTVYGVSADGRRLLVQTIQYVGHPAWAVALLGPVGSPLRVVASRVVDPDAAVPVRLPLPDGLGTLVAAEGAAFGFRLRSGPWQDAGRDAALVPAGAVELRVTPPNGPASTVPLR